MVWTRQNRGRERRAGARTRACRVIMGAAHRNRRPLRPLESPNLRRNTPMDEDRLTGSVKTIGGQVEEGLGRASGDVKTQLQGKARQMEGALQDAYGQAKETAAGAMEAISERASAAEDVLRATIEQRPYTTAAI